MDDSWIFFVSKGNYMFPSVDFRNAATIMDAEFQTFHGKIFTKENSVFDKLTSIVMQKTNNQFPREVIHCLVRTRTYIKIRHLNKKIHENNLAKRREKKLSKVTNVKPQTEIQ